MAWNDDAFGLRLASGESEFFFRAGSVEYAGERREGNQAVTVAETGKVYVAELTTTVVTFYEFVFKELAYSSTTEGSAAYYGFAMLATFLDTIAKFRYNTCQIKLAGLARGTAGNWYTCRYWGGDISGSFDRLLTTGHEGVYSGKLTFRKEP